MPTYEYECSACHTRLELFQGINAPRRRVCPACRRAKLKRLVSGGGGLLFRGPGFHCTDYPRQPRPKPKKDAP